MGNIGIKIGKLIKLAIVYNKNLISQKSFARRMADGLIEVGTIMKKEQSVFIPISEVVAIQAYVDDLKRNNSYKHKFSTRGQINYGI